MPYGVTRQFQQSNRDDSSVRGSRLNMNSLYTWLYDMCESIILSTMKPLKTEHLYSTAHNQIE